jgi:cellulose synthase (UDP-forming)
MRRVNRVSVGAVLVVLALLAVNLQRWSGRPLPWPWPSTAPALPVTALPAAGIAWGVYDPGGRFAGAGDMTIEQLYRPWTSAGTREITEGVHAIRGRGRVPLVGLEPWPFVWEGKAEGRLFADVSAGVYDVPIRQACVALGREAPQVVLVRWGHEMDLLGRFPWSTGDAPGFVSAYRHFVETCRGTGATNLRFVWSPGGDSSLQDYWPGDAFVDYVGLTTLGFGAWDVDRGAARPNTFREIFETKYALVQGYGKPVLVCEFASTGPAAHQQRWVAEAGEAFAAYPLLRGIVYFNAVDPVAWGASGVPDWRVPLGVFPPVPPVSPVPPGVVVPGAVPGR